MEFFATNYCPVTNNIKKKKITKGPNLHVDGIETYLRILFFFSIIILYFCSC